MCAARCPSAPCRAPRRPALCRVVWRGCFLRARMAEVRAHGRRVGVGSLAGLCLGVAMCQRRWTQLSHLGEVLSPVRAEAGNAPRFPRPCTTVPPGPSPPAPTKASARLGAGRALAGGFGPRLVLMQAQRVAGAMAPAKDAAEGPSPAPPRDICRPRPFRAQEPPTASRAGAGPLSGARNAQGRGAS
jgi:hypothetical protein